MFFVAYIYRLWSVDCQLWTISVNCGPFFIRSLLFQQLLEAYFFTIPASRQLRDVLLVNK